MARDFTKNTSNYMRLGTGSLNALFNGKAVLSIGALVYLDSLDIGTNDNRIITSVINSGSAGLLLGVDKSGGTARVKVGARSTSADGFQARTGTAETVPTGSWVHLGGVVNIGADTITPYVNGSADNGGSVTFGTATYTEGAPTIPDAIGSDGTPTQSTQIDGRIAELAIWGVDIGVAGFAALAALTRPSAVSASDLIVYFKLLGDTSPEPCEITALEGTITGTIAQDTHPTMNDGVGGMSIPLVLQHYANL